MSCPFCEPKQRVLKENKNAYALLSNPRKVEGHFLVIPKRHIEKPWELTDEELKDVFDLIKFVQQRIVPTFTEGVDIRQNYRPFVPEGTTKVNHIHYHIFPRSKKDALYAHSTEDDLWDQLSQEEHDRIAKLLE